VAEPNELNHGLLLGGSEEFELAGRAWMVEVFPAFAVAGLAKGAVRETGAKSGRRKRM